MNYYDTLGSPCLEMQHFCYSYLSRSFFSLPSKKIGQQQPKQLAHQVQSHAFLSQHIFTHTKQECCISYKQYCDLTVTFCFLDIPENTHKTIAPDVNKNPSETVQSVRRPFFKIEMLLWRFYFSVKIPFYNNVEQIYLRS